MTEKLPFHYDDKYNTLSCYVYADFIKTVALLQTKNFIDVEKTLKTLPFLIHHKDGTETRYYKWYNIFKDLEANYGIKHDVYKSRSIGNMFKLYMDKPDVLSESKEDTTPKVLESKSLMSFYEIPVEDDGIDWDAIWGFQDDKHKRDSKNNLEAYCEEKFGINLRKNQHFEDMVTELKEFLSKE